MNKKRKIGRKLLSFLLTLAMVVGLVPGMSLTAYAEESDEGVEVLITDIDCENYKDKTGEFTTDDGIATISFSTTPTFHEWYGWYKPNGDLTITVTAANDDYPISKCMFQCYSEGREDSTDPFEVTISYNGNWNETTATINDETQSSKGLKHIGFFSRITPDHTALTDKMLIQPGETLVPNDYYYKTADHVYVDEPEYHADFKQGYLYTLVRGNIERKQVDPSYDPELYEDVFVANESGDHYAFADVYGKFIYDAGWTVTNHSDGLLVSQGTSENALNPDDRITTYSFSVHEKEINDVTLDTGISNGTVKLNNGDETTIEVEAGDTVTLNVTADNGYQLSEISAKYLEVQSVSELMEMMEETKYYTNPSDPEYSTYFQVAEDKITLYQFYGDALYALSSTADLDKSKGNEGVYTATAGDITWKFTVKKEKIINIACIMGGNEYPFTVESTGTIADPTYSSVDLTPVTEGEQYTFEMPAIDVTVSATFEKLPVVTFDTNGGSTVTPQAVEEGECATRPDDPTKQGYYFGGWYKDAECTQPYSFGEVTSDITVYARWGEHKVTWSACGYTKEDVFTGTAPDADSDTAMNMIVEDRAPAGSTFAGWKTETDASGNVTYTAQFSYAVTYKIVNGTWSNGETADITENVIGESKPASVPIGMKAYEGYTGGAWDTAPADSTITGATVFTYTFTAKQSATVTKAPTAKTLTYNGQAQALVTAGTATGGTMQYALGTEAEAKQPYATSIPKATDAGTYYVWYKVVGDDNHSDTAPACVEVTVKSRPVYQLSAPSSALTVTSEIGTITRVTVDGKTVNSKYYFISGSNVVLSEEFMSTLAPGKHTIRLYDGKTSATATWTIEGTASAQQAKTAATGDAGVTHYGVLAAAAAAAICAVLACAWVARKRKAA